MRPSIFSLVREDVDCSVARVCRTLGFSGARTSSLHLACLGSLVLLGQNGSTPPSAAESRAPSSAGPSGCAHMHCTRTYCVQQRVVQLHCGHIPCARFADCPSPQVASSQRSSLQVTALPLLLRSCLFSEAGRRWVGRSEAAAAGVSLAAAARCRASLGQVKITWCSATPFSALWVPAAA